MPNAPDTNPEMLELLIDLATLQRTLKPVQQRYDRLVAQRKPILKRLLEVGADPKLIHELTKVPLSTIYLIAGRPRKPIQRDRGGEGS